MNMAILSHPAVEDTAMALVEAAEQVWVVRAEAGQAVVALEARGAANRALKSPESGQT